LDNHICAFIICARQSKESEKGLLNTNKKNVHICLKSEGEVTSLSGADKREVRDNREKWREYREK
jgi:hypothetical protein